MDPMLARAFQSWDLNHNVLWMLPLCALMYARGFALVHLQMPRRYPVWRLASFTFGILVVFIAIASPLDALGALLLYIHMTQHMLLIMVAPPLIWLGQPIVPMLRALPPKLAKRLLGPLLRCRALRAAGRAFTRATVCWLALTAAMLLWHVPQLYEIALHSEGWHEIQHACFFAAALLFWSRVIHVWPNRLTTPRWTTIPYLVSADLINTALSAVLSFSTHVLYPTYASAPRILAISPIEDQALAGVIMWVPGSIAFLLPAVMVIVQLFEARPHTPRRANLQVGAT
ncbi:MAG: cytochrome c oxidase assembly protein [Blastocatellia bacterium]|nr:MAG: cytochrome c oxidase assembly protein [Blastocatellia bacterium]